MVFLSCVVVMACNNSERALSQTTRTMGLFLLSSGFDERRFEQTNYWPLCNPHGEVHGAGLVGQGAG